jgi:hypothetical protein
MPQGGFDQRLVRKASCEDAEFRDRIRRVHLFTLYNALWIAGPRAKLELVDAFVGVVAQFSEPVASLAQVIFRDRP